MKKLIIQFALTFIFCLSSFVCAEEVAEVPEVNKEQTQEQSQLDRRVYVGVYLSDVSGFDIKEGRFKADLQVWCKWLGTKETPPIIFANGEIEEQNIVSQEDEGAWHSIRWRVQGTFRGTFPLHKFPFDQQKLKVEIDLPKEQGQLLPDLAGSGMAKQFSITGWEYEPYFKAEKTPRQYYSDFGSIQKEGDPLKVNSAAFVLSLHRPIAAYFLKFGLPLLIIVLTALISFFLPLAEIEAKIGMIITALLSSIALSFSQAESLPDVPYPVVADKLFVGSYVVILVALLTTVLISIFDSKDKEHKALKVNRYSIIGLSIVMLIGLVYTGISALPEKDKAKDFTTQALYPIHKSSRNDLVYGTMLLNSLNSSGILYGLLSRGLYYNVKGGKAVTHLIQEIPSVTNENVRFLPNGGMVVRWRLKPNLKWGDGSPITADDFVFSVETKFEDQLSENKKNQTHEHENLITEIKKIDNLTVEISYSQRLSMNLSSFYIYPKKPLEKVFKEKGSEGIKELLKTNPPPLDGPYIIDKYVLGKYVLLKQNPHFAGIKPNIERIKILAVEKWTDSVEKGEAQLTTNVSTITATKLLNNPKTKIQSEPASNFYFIKPDVTKAPFNNLFVRQAIAHAINKKKLIEILFLPLEKAEAADSYLPADSEFYPKDIKQYEYNPAKALQLIRQSGIKLPIEVNLYAAEFREEFPEYNAIETIKTDLEKIGFKLNLVSTKGKTSNTFKDGLHGGLHFTAKLNDFSSLSYWNIARNKARLFNEELPQYLYDQSMVELNSKIRRTFFVERKKLLTQRFQREWAEKLPVIPLVRGGEISSVDPNLKGWDPAGSIVSNSDSGEASNWWNVEYLYFDK